MEIDYTQALKDAENTLRDFIVQVMEQAHGSEWITQSGVTEDRVESWKRKQEEERRRLLGGTADTRLIYYADFFDLKTVLKKNWNGAFSDAFGKYRQLEPLLDILEALRNPEAHRRELLPHQKHLVVGISGEIRNKIARYRSELDTSDSYYPRIESVIDNLGNAWSPGASSLSNVNTNKKLRIGDTLEFVVAATDPMDQDLDYIAYLSHRGRSTEWQSNNSLQITIEEADIRRRFRVEIRIKSKRPYHARGQYDDKVTFIYEVLPPRPESEAAA